MKKIGIIFLVVVALALSSCSYNITTGSYESSNDSQKTENAVSESDTENFENDQDVSIDRVFLNTENIGFENDDSSFSFIGSLRDIKDYRINGAPMWKCAIIRFIPKEYKFIFYKQSRKGSSGEYNYGVYTVLVSDITETVSAYNGCDIKQTDNADVRQSIEIKPSDDYMDYFIKRYGDENEGILSVPDGLYELEKDKLIEMGISDIYSYGSPILEYNKEYYAFVTTDDGGITLYDSTAYCDANLEPVEIMIKNTRYGWENKHWSSELIEMIREIKK